MMGLWMGFLGAYPYWPGKACAIATQQTTKQINVFIFSESKRTFIKLNNSSTDEFACKL